MKRDMALIRRIMEAIESDENHPPFLRIREVLGLGDTKKNCGDLEVQMTIATQAGFILYTSDDRYYLTWKGHDWLDEQRAKEQPQQIGDSPFQEPPRIPENPHWFLDTFGKCRYCKLEWSQENQLTECPVSERERSSNRCVELLPHEPDDEGVCRWCDKQVLKPELNEVCRRRRGEVSDRPIKPMDFVGGVQ